MESLGFDSKKHSRKLNKGVFYLDISKDYLTRKDKMYHNYKRKIVTSPDRQITHSLN